MAYSTQEVVSDGTLTLLDISINYLERDEVHVSFNSVENALPWAWVGTSDHKIAFSPAVPNGVVVLVNRATNLAAPRHVFSTGAAFTAESLDEDIAQILHIAQEASEGSLGGDYYQDINMHGNQITNLGNAVSPSDAVPLSQYQADASGAYTSKVAAASSAASALSSKNSATASATSAGTSAGTASSAASTATTKASEAAVSASAALASQVAAASTYDSFDDRYLGSKATEPTVDNDGAALLSGALFFHSGIGMKVWNATAWELLGGATTGLAPVNAPVFVGDVGIGGTPFGQALLVKSTDAFDILDAPTTAGIHVMGGGVAGVGAYGGAITLSQTAGSTRPGAGIASVQSSVDADQCGLALMVHGSSSTNNQLQQAVTVNADRSMTCTNTVSAVTQMRIKVANDTTDIAAILRKDASGFYLLFTDDGNADGSYNTMRPFTVSDITGNTGFGTQHLSTVRVFIEGAGNTGGTYSLICRNIDGTTGLFVDNTGLVGTRALKTEKVAVTAPDTADGNIYSGTYTPTLTNLSNLTSSVATIFQYMRVGNVVTVSGRVGITPTVAADTPTTLRFSLPIASNFVGGENCAGTASTFSSVVAAKVPFTVYGDHTFDTAMLAGHAQSTALTYLSINFTYRIQ